MRAVRAPAGEMVEVKARVGLIRLKCVSRTHRQDELHTPRLYINLPPFVSAALAMYVQIVPEYEEHYVGSECYVKHVLRLLIRLIELFCGVLRNESFNPSPYT